MNNFNIDIDALAPMIFLKNPNDLPIELNILDPLKNTKDIFYFCTDLFLKGLFFMNANKDMQVVINDLALDDIFSTVKKLKNAKIQTNINNVQTSFDQTIKNEQINVNINDRSQVASSSLSSSSKSFCNSCNIS